MPVKLQDVAAAARVSVSTAWMAISNHPSVNPDTRARVLAVSRRLKYRPLRRARPAPPPGRRPVRAVRRLGFGYVAHDLRNPQAQLKQLHTISSAAEAQRFRLDTVIVNGTDPDAAERLGRLAAGVEGLLVYGFIDRDLAGSLAPSGVPRVSLGNLFGNPLLPPPEGWHVVTSDPLAMGQLATTLLLDAGHRRVGLVAGRAFAGLWSERWLAGYRLALQEAEVEFDESIVAMTDGVEAAERLPKRRLPTGFVFPDPSLADDFSGAMADAGRPIRRDAIVVGGNPESLAATRMTDAPSLVQPVEPLVQTALRLLRDLIEGRGPTPCKIILPFESHNLERIARVGKGA